MFDWWAHALWDSVLRQVRVSEEGEWNGNLVLRDVLRP